MKKKYTITLLIFLSIFLISNIFSSWIVSFPIEGETEITTSSDFPVAYIERNGEVREYISIESALLEAQSSDIVNVYLDEDTKGAKTITRNCVIKEGVTLNVANQLAEGSSNLIDLQKEKSDGTMEAKGSGGSISTSSKNTVKVNAGVKITNNGTIVIGGILSPGGGGYAYCGQTSGDYGEIQLGNNAKIISYGEIRCCGYITESSSNNGSSVEIKDGSLKIPFIIRDFCGGSGTIALVAGSITNMVGITGIKIPYADKKSPFNQFELRNIQCEYKIYFAGNMYGYSNIIVNGEKISKSIPFIGGTNLDESSHFFEINNERGYTSIKYDVDTQIMHFNFYGGANINDLKINIKMPLTIGSTTLGTINEDISMREVYFPMSWRVDISLHKLENQIKATYDASNQRIKLMPGSKITVEEGTYFKVKAMNVYTYFDYSEISIGAKKYNEGYSISEEIPPAEFYVNGSFKCVDNFGGRIICGDNIDINNITDEIIDIGTKGNITYEGYKNSGTTMDKVLEIEEECKLINYKNFIDNKTLAVGVVKFKDGVTPSYSITANGSTDDLSGNSIYSIPSTNNSFIPCFKLNISTAYFNDNTDLCQSCSPQVLTENINTLIINGSSNETNISISGNSHSVSIGGELQLTATVAPTTSTIIWSSSDKNIAEVDSNGLITGKKEGTVIISARISDSVIEDNYEVTVSNDVIKVDILYNNEIYNNETIKVDVYNSSQTITIKTQVTPSDYNPENHKLIWERKDGVNIETKYDNDDRNPYVVIECQKRKEQSITLILKENGKEINSITISASNCLIEGTLVTLASGEKVPVESLKAGDELLVFNHETGKLDTAPVLFNDSESESEYEIINLEFSNESKVKVISEHGFFDLNLMKYVYIDAYNYKDYIGHNFYSIDSFNNKVVTKLNRAYLTKERCKVYSPVTEYHLNYFTEDILSMPGGITGLFNIFDYNDNLKYNEETKNWDIEQYGLFTYDDFKDLVPLEMFNAFPTPYLKVAIGKGLLTWDDLYYYIERYGPLM